MFLTAVRIITSLRKDAFHFLPPPPLLSVQDSSVAIEIKNYACKLVFKPLVIMSIGKINEFKVHSDDWNLYVERLEQYFVVNKIVAEMQVPTLITVMGAEGYELLVNLCTPVKPKSKTFAQITEIMQKHLQPKPSPLTERYKLRNRKQKDGESIAEYVAVLKKMSIGCEFGAGLEESLRDQLVCGVRSEVIRQRLFAEEKVDFAKAYTLSMSMEAAEKNAAVVEGQGVHGERMTAQCQAMAVGREWRGKWNAGRQSAVGPGAGGAGPPRGAVKGTRPWGNSPPNEQQRQQQCKACGRQHNAATCKFARYVCRVCNQQGHLKKMCPYAAVHHTTVGGQEDVVDDGGSSAQSDSEGSEEVTYTNINTLSATQCKPIIITLNVHGKDVQMECDTGSAVSCISYELYKNQFHDLEMKPSKLLLKYYTGEIVQPVGVVKPVVKYRNCKKELELFIIKGAKTMLLGRHWLSELNVSIANVQCNSLSSNDEFDFCGFSSRYSKVFEDGLGRFTGDPVSIHLREGARPVFMRARPLAYALRAPVERALEQLVSDGVLTPIERSEWATPIVPVLKKDGTIRICADYKLTLNKVLLVDRYPLPRVEDLLARLHGGVKFSKIDLSQAYAQFLLDETKQFTVINTHKGLFVYNRLVYGLASSPGIFQRHLEQLFVDLPYVGVFLDDVIITGRDTKEHIDNLNKVFDRLQAHGLKVKKEKCEFFKQSINYLGYVISKEGVHTCPDKVKAIRDTPAPCNVTELRAFIGMVMYYGRFIRNISTIMAPLYNLLKVNVKYNWCNNCQTAFGMVKEALCSSEVLAHYSLELPVVLTTDASGVGVGAVLSHLTPAGERPVAYASRSLTAAERAYAQIDREALAIVYGVRKFHHYLYGRKFILRTDHKPLTFILGNKVGIPVMAASRLQRWAVLLAGYDYDIEFVSSGKNCADALSRLPHREKREGKTKEITYVNFVERFLPVTNSDVCKATSKDPTLSRLMTYIQSGWPLAGGEESMKPYFQRRNELYVENGCIMWGYRMVIPTTLRKQVLCQLHSSHMGIVKTKSLARSYVWWPRIDEDVEGECRACDTCAAEADAPPHAPPQPWPFTTLPWTRIHIDFLGPIKNKTFLVLVDAHSKWLEIFEMLSTKATTVIKVLRSVFARFGLPMELVSDQGPPFTSTEFREFLKNNGIKQFFSPAYHPSSNGAAENAVKTCKRAIKKALREKIDIDAALQAFLLMYRNTPHSTTGQSPAVLLQRRPLRNRLDLLRNDQTLEGKVRTAQDRQVAHSGGVQRSLVEGEPVWYRGHGNQDKWNKGTVENREGVNRYIVNSGDGRLVSKHIDHMRQRKRMSGIICPESNDAISTRGENVALAEPIGLPNAGEAGTDLQERRNPGKGDRESSSLVTSPLTSPQHSSPLYVTPPPPPTPVSRRYPLRDRKPVQRLTYDRV